MKSLFFLATFFYATNMWSQQAFSSRIKFLQEINPNSVVLNQKKQNKIIKKQTDEALKLELRNKYDNENLKVKDRIISFDSVSNWGIYGIGNLNTESFSNVNAGGKISGYKRMDKSNLSFTTMYFSFNKNATNNDSLLAGTFLFPDIGNTSAAITLEYTRFLFKKGNTFHLLGPFFEFSDKNIKVGSEDSLRQFSTLNYVLGIKYHNWTPNKELDVAFTVAPYFSIVNVPDEDNEDYRFLFKSPNLKSAIPSLGVRFTVQFNNFQAFADLRHVLGNEQAIPVRQLRGFNSNIGIVFNAEIVER